MLESKSPYVSYAKAGLPASPAEVKKNEESTLIFTSHTERGEKCKKKKKLTKKPIVSIVFRSEHRFPKVSYQICA